MVVRSLFAIVIATTIVHWTKIIITTTNKLSGPRKSQRKSVTLVIAGTKAKRLQSLIATIINPYYKQEQQNNPHHSQNKKPPVTMSSTLSSSAHKSHQPLYIRKRLIIYHLHFLNLHNCQNVLMIFCRRIQNCQKIFNMKIVSLRNS